jgi:glycerophosphoryl diester phosphodiesterase
MNPLLDPDLKLVIGHRGAAAYAPENTLVSFRRAIDLGADALEFDVRLAADGVAVVMHDPTVDRTTDRTGPVHRFTSAELARFDAGYRFTPDGRTWPFRGTGVGVPSLRDVLTAFPAVPLLIEVKEPRVQEAVARELVATGAADRTVVAGNDWRSLTGFGKPPFSLGACRRDIARLYFRLGEPDTRCRSYAVPDRFHGLPVPTRRFVQAARKRAGTVHVWTVDDPRAAIRHWANGVNGIVSNRPDLIFAARAAT